MFKTPVVLGALLFCHLYLITGCSFGATSSFDTLSSASQRVIAQDLVSAISTHSIDKKKPIYLRANSGQEWLARALADEFRTNQYSLASDPNAARHLSVTATELGSNTLHVSLITDGKQIVERVFRFEPVSAGELPDEFIESDDDPFALASSMNNSNSRQGQPPAPLPAKSVAMQVPSTTAAREPAGSVIADESVSDTCAITELQHGSLKQNLVQILSACGWRLIGWPVDPEKQSHELDWLVPRTQSLEYDSLEVFTRALEVTFDLEIELDPTFNTMRVQLRD